MNTKAHSKMPNWLRFSAIILLAGAGLFTVLQSRVLAGPITGGPGSPPFTKLGVYQGVISVVPGALGDSVMEIGNAGRDIKSTGFLGLFPNPGSNVYINNGSLCFGTAGVSTDCASSWAGLGARPLQDVLAAGNRTTFDIILGSVGGPNPPPTGDPVSGAGRIDVTAISNSKHAIIARQNVGGNNQAAVIAENTQTTAGFAAEFRGRTRFNNPSTAGEWGSSGDAIYAFTNSGNAAVSAKNNNASGWAGYFAGRVYVRDNLGVGTESPVAKLSVGAASQFRVDASGNVTRINDVAYSWPGLAGAPGANTVLTHTSGGNLSWIAPATGISGSGTTNRIPRFTAATSIGDSEIFQNGINVGISQTAAAARLTVNNPTALGKVGAAGDAIYAYANSGNAAISGEQANASGWAGYFSGRVSIGTASQFQVDTAGNLVRIDNVPYDWPNANASGVLTNNGAGGLSWAPAGGNQTLDQVLAVGNTANRDKDIILSDAVSAPPPGPGLGRIEVRADSATQDVVHIKHNVGGNTKSAIYAENNAGGWSGYFSGNANFVNKVGVGPSGTLINADPRFDFRTNLSSFGGTLAVNNWNNAQTFCDADGDLLADNPCVGSLGDGLAAFANSTNSALYAEQQHPNGSGFAGFFSGRVRVNGPVIPFQVAQSTKGPGTVTTSGTNVTGSGTSFQNTFNAGDFITVRWADNSTEIQTIATITSSTVLTVAVPFSKNEAGRSYTVSGAARLTVRGSGNVGIGSILPDQRFTVGAGNQFAVNGSGDVVRIRGQSMTWPAANAAGVLTNDGSGVLTWGAGGGGSQTLDQVLEQGNRTTYDIILGSVGGANPIAGTPVSGAGRIDVTSTDINKDAINAHQNVVGNAKSAIYAENNQPGGWAGYFSGHAFVGETLANRPSTKARLVINAYYNDPGDPGGALPPVDCLPGPGTAPCLGSPGDGLAVYARNWTSAIYAEQQQVGSLAGYFSGNVAISGDLSITGNCSGCSPWSVWPPNTVILANASYRVGIGDGLAGSNISSKLSVWGKRRGLTDNFFDGLSVGERDMGDLLRVGYLDDSETLTDPDHSKRREAQIVLGAGTFGDAEGSLHIGSRGNIRSGISFYTSPDGDGVTGATGLLERLKISGPGNTHIIGAPNGLCFGSGTTDCRNTWTGFAGNLDSVLAAGNKSNRSIELGNGTGSSTTTTKLNIFGEDTGQPAAWFRQNIGSGGQAALKLESAPGNFALETSGRWKVNTANLTWPGANAAGVLTNNGSGVLSWGAAGGGSLPSGDSGQTLRHNGSGWEAVSNIYNSLTNIGLGTDNPYYSLDIQATFGGVNLFSSSFDPDAHSPKLLLSGASAQGGFGGALPGAISGPYLQALSDGAGTFGAHRLAFYQHPNDGGYLTVQEAMTISSEGNVGINHNFINDISNDAKFVVKDYGTASDSLDTSNSNAFTVYSRQGWNGGPPTAGSAIYAEQQGAGFVSGHGFAGYFSGPVEINYPPLAGDGPSSALKIGLAYGAGSNALEVIAPSAARSGSFLGSALVRGYSHSTAGTNWPTNYEPSAALEVYGAASGFSVDKVVSAYFRNLGDGTAGGASVFAEANSNATTSYAAQFFGRVGMKSLTSPSGPFLTAISTGNSGTTSCTTYCSNSGLTCVGSFSGGSATTCAATSADCLCRF